MKATVITKRLSATNGTQFELTTETVLAYPEIVVDLDDVSDSGDGFVTITCYRTPGVSQDHLRGPLNIAREWIINYRHFVSIDMEATEADVQANDEALKKLGERSEAKRVGSVLLETDR